jgi:hypothetical protein
MSIFVDEIIGGSVVSWYQRRSRSPDKYVLEIISRYELDPLGYVDIARPVRHGVIPIGLTG